MRRELCIALFAVAGLLQATTVQAFTPSPQSKISVNGVVRDYRMFRPATDKPLPLVLVLHGRRCRARKLRRRLSAGHQPRLERRPDQQSADVAECLNRR
jgi:poly(3-hydroxybutyrate) depolymerase